MFVLKHVAKTVLASLLARLTDAPAKPPATARATRLRVIQGGKSPAKAPLPPSSCHDTSASSRPMG